MRAGTCSSATYYFVDVVYPQRITFFSSWVLPSVGNPVFCEQDWWKSEGWEQVLDSRFKIKIKLFTDGHRSQYLLSWAGKLNCPIGPVIEYSW